MDENFVDGGHADKNFVDENVVPENRRETEFASSVEIDGSNEHRLETAVHYEPVGDEILHPRAVENCNEIEKLRKWAIDCNISHTHLDKLLRILRENLLPDLPKSSKTFLASNCARYFIQDMADCSGEMGQFVYFGIATGLKKCIAAFHEGPIEIIANVDGLPLSRSGKKNFWPILCKVHYNPDMYKPFEVAIYCGSSKPKNFYDYFIDFVTEINYLQAEGIVIHEKKFDVHLKCIVADTPARAYCKGIKNHGGYSACERCVVYGKRVKTGKGACMVYPGINHPKRTNASFRERHDLEHHTGNSPFEKIIPEIDMTRAFLLDPMHLLFIGVMKRMFIALLSGPLKTRLSVAVRQEISRRMLCLATQIPVEFQRKTRGIDCLLKWKATEFRFFLLYCGPIIFQGLLREQFLKHFLLLHAAMRILCSSDLILRYKEKARKYLEIFVLSLPFLYGEQAQVINMHNLVHLVEDIEYLGCDLAKINCFPFESHLGKIKYSIRTPKNPLMQFCIRRNEADKVPCAPRQRLSKFTIDKCSIQENQTVVLKLTFDFSFTITAKQPNNVVLLVNGSIMEIHRIYYLNTQPEIVYVEGKVWERKREVYKYPRTSSSLGMWKLEDDPSLDETVIYPISFLEKKCIRLRLALKPNRRTRTFVVAMLHT